MLSLIVDRSNPSEVERIAKEQISKGFRIINKDLCAVPLKECFKAVTSDGTNTILFIPEKDIVIDETLRDSVAAFFCQTFEEDYREHIITRYWNFSLLSRGVFSF
jgi:hypothetical protein